MISRDSRVVPAMLFVVGCVSGVWQLVNLPRPAFGAYFEWLNVARSLASSGVFGNPFSAAATGPTAHLAPLHPLFLALLIRLLGYGPIFVLVVEAILVVVIALHAALLPAVSGLLIGSRVPGIWAGALAALLPLFQMYSNENLYLALFLMVFLLATEAAVRRYGAVSAGSIAGIFAGFLVLWNPPAIVIVLIWAARLMWVHLPDRRSRLTFGKTAAIGCILVCTPWTVRNYRTMGALFFIRDNFGLELYTSNNGCAAPTLIENLQNGCLNASHPNVNPREAGLVRSMGEVEYNRYRMTAAVEWIVQHPGRFLQLTLARIFRFWFPPASLEVYAPSLWVVTVLSFGGMGIALRRKLRDAWTLLAVVMIFPLPYYVIQADVRYRSPIIWASLLLAGLTLEGAAALIRNWITLRRCASFAAIPAGQHASRD